MEKRSGGVPPLSGREKLLGGLLLVCYLTVLPAAVASVFSLAENLLGIRVAAGTRETVYYGLLLALTLLVFRGLWGRSARVLFAVPARIFGTLGLGLVAFYGLNELAARLLRLVLHQPANLNDAAISAQLGASPGRTVLILVLLAPVVEETLFRGYVFGLCRTYSRPAAYVFSSLLFAMVHVWQYAAGNFSYLLLAAQYIVPALVLAWAYERSGSLWGSVLLHSAVNALAVLSVL